jgi:hypothetical protein
MLQCLDENNENRQQSKQRHTGRYRQREPVRWFYEQAYCTSCKIVRSAQNWNVLNRDHAPTNYFIYPADSGIDFQKRHITPIHIKKR